MANEISNPTFNSAELDQGGQRESVSIPMTQEEARTDQSYTLTWTNLNVYHSYNPTKKNCFANLFSKSQEKKPLENFSQHIIKNSNGIAFPGQIVALMGASGAGKTTLLRTLALRHQSLKIEGAVKLNGRSVKDLRSDFTQLLGYVEQDDAFIGTLTVREHLLFQAMLRLPKDWTDKEKLRRVKTVLKDMNLEKCQNNKIGIPYLGIAGISGGERRRLSFASESITNPSVLFCDEPTSGLDSFMARSLVKSMKKIASQGKTILCTIHQPASETFELFDSLYLMDEGRTVFVGSLPDAALFFSSHGMVCPKNHNIADFYINKLSIKSSSKEKCRERNAKLCDSFEQSDHNRNLMSQIRKYENSAGDKHLQSKQSRDRLDNSSGSLTQIKWLLWRNFLNIMRNPNEIRINLIQSVIMAIIYGLTFMNSGLTQDGIQSINGALFYIVNVNTFGCANAVITNFPTEMPIFRREYKSGIYSTFNYYFSKVFCDLPRFIVIPFLFCAVAYWLTDLYKSTEAFFVYAFMCIFVSIISVSFGTLVSICSRSISVAFAVSQPILIIFMVYGGFFLNNKTVPGYFIWIKYISWCFYSNEILTINQWKNVDKIACSANETACFKNGTEVLASLNMSQENFGLDFLWLAIIFFGYHILGYGCLLIKARRM